MATAAEIQLVYVFSALLVLGAVLLALLPPLHHAWTFAASRRFVVVVIAVILLLGIGAVLLIGSAISDQIYFLPIALVTVGLRLISPYLLYRRVEDRFDTNRTWRVMRWLVGFGFLGLAAILAYHLILIASGTEASGLAILSEQLIMALGASFLIVRAGLQVRPHRRRNYGPSGPPQSCSPSRSSSCSRTRCPRSKPFTRRRDSWVGRSPSCWSRSTSEETVRHADGRRSQLDFDSELFREFLVPVADRDFRHARDVRDLTLRPALVAEDRRDVNRRRRHAGGPATRCEFLVLRVFQDFDGAGLDLARELQLGAEPGNVVLGLRRHELQFQLAGHEAIRAADLLPPDAGRISDLVEGPRHIALPACGVQGRRDDALDGPAADQVLVHGLAVHHRGRLADVPRQPHATRHPVQFAQGEREVPFRRVAHANPALPLPQAVQLGAVPRRDRLAVRVLVLPSDRRREPFVVDRVRHRGAGAGSLLALLDVERPPFRALVDHLVGQDEAALFTDELASLVVERKVARIALGASSDFFGFFDFLGRHELPPRQRRRLQSGTARGRPPAERPRKVPAPVRRL